MLLILHTDSQVIIYTDTYIFTKTYRHKQEQVSKVDNPMLLILHTDSHAIILGTHMHKQEQAHEKHT